MSVAEDTLQGAAAIAGVIGNAKRQTNYLLETKKLPAFKMGKAWHMRKSTYLAFIARLESDATSDDRKHPMC